MMIKKGKTKKVELEAQGKLIPSIIDNSIECLEKWYDDSLSDKNKSGESNIKNQREWGTST